MTSEAMKDSKNRVRVAMVVPNSCDPDFRVVKEAEVLAEAGYEVRVYCASLRPYEAPNREMQNRVLYIRCVCLPGAQAFTYWHAKLFKRSRAKTKITQIIKTDQKLKPEYRSGPKKKSSFIESILQKSKARLITFMRRSYINTFWYLRPHLVKQAWKKDIYQWQPQIIHAHDEAAMLLAESVVRRCRSALVIDSHELETHRSPPLPPRQKQTVRRHEARVFRQADLVITVSQKIAEHLAEEYKITKPKVLYNVPIDQPENWKTRWSGTQPLDVRHDTGLSPDAFLMVYTGNVAVNRGIEESLEAMAWVKAQVPDVASQIGALHLALVGRCTPAVRQSLDAKIAALGLEGQVFFLNPVPANFVPPYISTADLSLIPIVPAALSYEYAMPNKLFEAMHAGLPILASRLVEMSAVIETYQLGESFQHSDRKDFAKTLVKILPRLQHYRDNSKRAEALQKFSWSAQKEILLKSYRGLKT